MSEMREQFVRDKLENGVLNDHDRAMFTEELAEIEASKQQIEEIIAGPEDPEASFTLTVNGMTVDFRAEAANEKSYQALRIVTQLKLQELEQQNQTEIKALKASYESDIRQMELQVTNVNAHNKSLEEEVSDLKNEITVANLIASQKDAALENSQQNAEAYRLQVEELRNQVSKPNVPTNLDSGALAEAIRASQAAKEAIYNVVEISGIKSTAISVDTNETIEFHPNYIGKYRVISHEEALQFRAELEANKANIPDDAGEAVEVPSNEPEVTIIAPSFPTEVSNADNGSQLGGDTATTESVPDHDGGTVTREEFDKLSTEVMNRLYNLELAVHGVDYVNTGDAA